MFTHDQIHRYGSMQWHRSSFRTVSVLVPWWLLAVTINSPTMSTKMRWLFVPWTHLLVCSRASWYFRWWALWRMSNKNRLPKWLLLDRGWLFSLIHQLFFSYRVLRSGHVYSFLCCYSSDSIPNSVQWRALSQLWYFFKYNRAVPFIHFSIQ